MLFKIIILLLAIPSGSLVGWLCRDELIAGRKWFKVLITFSIVFGIGCELFGCYTLAWTFGFIAIVSMISYWKSFDGKWIKKKV